MRHTPGDAERVLLARQSAPAVTDAAPDDAEVLRLLGIAATMPDHAALRPWRVIALRGAARDRLGAALAEASPLPEGPARERLALKPLRAPLLLAIVASPQPSIKVPHWEQEAVAAGVGHALALLLDDAGWGVMWRTGLQARTEPVSRALALSEGEKLLGWLYVGGRIDPERAPREPVDASDRFTSIRD